MSRRVGIGAKKTVERTELEKKLKKENEALKKENKTLKAEIDSLKEATENKEEPAE